MWNEKLYEMNNHFHPRIDGVVVGVIYVCGPTNKKTNLTAFSVKSTASDKQVFEKMMQQFINKNAKWIISVLEKVDEELELKNGKDETVKVKKEDSTITIVTCFY